jgi:8-oxo-dGTP diphosphatase
MTEPAPAGLRIRQGVRAIVVDPDERVLLVRWELPHDGRTVAVWGTPGGGVEPDEDMDAALRREMAEELGLGAVAIGPLVWVRTHIVPFVDGRWDGQHDRFFLVRTARFDPDPQLSREQLLAEHLVELRWWTRDELEAFEPTSTEFFAPRRFASLLGNLLRNGPPASPIDTGR